MNHFRRAWLRKWLLVVAVLVLFGVPFFRSYQERDRRPTLDEFYWVGQTYYYHLAIEQMDWSNPDWQLIPAWENPQLGRCVIGLGLQLDGLSVTNLDWLGYYYHIIYKAWGQGHERDLRQAVVNRMQPAVRNMVVNHNRFEYRVACITAGRAVMLLFGILSIFLVFILVSLYRGEVVAFVAALLFSLHPAVVMAYTHLGADILAMAFSLLTVLHFEWINRRVWRRWWCPGLCRSLICVTGGLSLAFAVGSKLNAVVVGFLGAALCLYYAVSWLRRPANESGESFRAMFAILLFSLLVFVVSNPVNYHHPLAALWKQYAVPQRIMQIQEQVLPGALHSGGERFSAVAKIVAFNSFGFMLLIGAFLVEVIGVWREGKQISLIAFWWLIAVAVVTAWIPFIRARYVLPVIAPSAVLAGCALGRCCRTAVSKMVACGKTTQTSNP